MVISPEAFKISLAEAGITHAAVIDEAFDSQAAVRLAVGVENFFGEIEDNPELAVLLNEKSVQCDDIDVFSTNGLSELWKCRSQFVGRLNELVKGLFLTAEEKLREPQTVSQHLQTLGLNVLSLSTLSHLSDDKPLSAELPSVRLVFLDYDLEGDDQLEIKGETRRSQLIAKRLAEAKGDAPFLVLFSNKPNVSELVESFRENTGYLRGTFAFITKNDAVDLTELCRQLSASCIQCKDLGRIQHFFFALKAQLKEVSIKVEKEVMQLNVQDYAFIQRLALQDDGAPLGEYMLDLFGAVLSYELREGAEVQTARRALDKLDFGQRHLPFSDQPSTPIQRIYRAVLTEPGIVDAEPHPQSNNGTLKDAKGNDYPAPPLLMLGDIFAHDDQHPVYIVVNPACDLNYSAGKRRPDLDLSVFLLSGQLEPLTAPINSNFEGKRMEWLEFAGRFWRVLWRHEQVLAVPLGQFAKWQQDTSYKRITRLSLPHSLALQQKWTSQLSRVGLSVNFPFFEVCDVQLHYPDTDGQWKTLGAKCTRIAIFARHPKDGKETSHFTFTTSGRDFLHEKLSALILSLGAFPVRAEAGGQLLGQAQLWEDLVEVPRKLSLRPQAVDDTTHGLLFAWGSIPNLTGLKLLSDDDKAKLGGDEKKKAALYEKVALVVVLTPS